MLGVGEEPTGRVVWSRPPAGRCEQTSNCREEGCREGHRGRQEAQTFGEGILWETKATAPLSGGPNDNMAQTEEGHQPLVLETAMVPTGETGCARPAQQKGRQCPREKSRGRGAAVGTWEPFRHWTSIRKPEQTNT